MPFVVQKLGRLVVGEVLASPTYSLEFFFLESYEANKHAGREVESQFGMHINK